MDFGTPLWDAKELQKTFDGVSRASKAIDSAATVGVAYQKFAELVQNFATEMSVAKDKAKSSQEVEVFKAFITALETYNDALKLWTAKMSQPFFESLLFEDREKIMIFSENAYLLAVGKKYDLNAEKVRGDTFLPANSVVVVLGKAHPKVEEANALLFGSK